MLKQASPSAALAAAALAGLLGVVACSDDKSEAPNGGPPGETKGEIKSTVIDPSMTLEKFTETCNENEGTVETHAHCGGVNTCKGFSYDDVTHELTAHTCKGLNTCSGYSCVIPNFEG